MAANGTASPDYSILAEFKGTITRPKTGLLYHCGLFLTAGMMVLLPLIYCAMLFGVGWAIYHYAVFGWGHIVRIGGIIVIFYFIPLLAGTVVFFFMLKPLLARRPKRAQPLALNPADNPLLYAFISKICDVVGAPAPTRIDMDCDLNASASFRRGLRSMTGNDLVLTIGLPLVANFSARELAGVIAHEFGHFTQGAGMRLSYIIRHINLWLARVAYQRDAWDEGLEHWSYTVRDGRVAIIVWSTQLAVWFSRLILKLLLLIGNVITGFMLRQMEYDADAYDIQVVGSETFESTERKLATLGAAMDQTYKSIRAQWKKSRQLPDNLSELLRQTHENLPPGVLLKIDDALGFRPTGLFDSHPSPADRIRRARMTGAPGIFHDDRPASSLFANFEFPARFVTLLHYTDNLGIPITDQMLVRIESKQEKAAQGYLAAVPETHAAEEFFLGVLPLLLPLHIPTPVPSANYEADIAELNQLSTGLNATTTQLAPIAAEYQESSTKLIKARAARCLIAAGVRIQPETFGLADATAATAELAETEAAAAREELVHSLREISTALNRRLQLALAIRLSDKGESGANFVAPESVNELVSGLNEAASVYSKHQEMMDALAVVDYVLAVMKTEGETPALSRALAAQRKIISSIMAEAPAETAAPKPGLHLAKQMHLAPAEMELLRQASRRWLADYEEGLDKLAGIAHGAEKMSGP